MWLRLQLEKAVEMWMKASSFGIWLAISRSCWVAMTFSCTASLQRTKQKQQRHSASCLAVPGVPHCECASSSDWHAVLIQVENVPSFNWCVCHDYTFFSNRQMAQVLVAHQETRKTRIGPWLHNSVTLEIVMYSCYVWDLSLSQGSTVHTVSRGYMVLISKTENTWPSELIK